MKFQEQLTCKCGGELIELHNADYYVCDYCRKWIKKKELKNEVRRMF